MDHRDVLRILRVQRGQFFAQAPLQFERSACGVRQIRLVFFIYYIPFPQVPFQDGVDKEVLYRITRRTFVHAKDVFCANPNIDVLACINACCLCFFVRCNAVFGRRGAFLRRSAHALRCGAPDGSAFVRPSQSEPVLQQQPHAAGDGDQRKAGRGQPEAFDVPLFRGFLAEIACVGLKVCILNA